MSKFTVKVYSNNNMNLYACNSVSIEGRRILMSDLDVYNHESCHGVIVRDCEAAYIENASGKTVYTLHQKADFNEEDPRFYDK